MSDLKFAAIPRVDIQRSVFDRSHGYKTTFDEGKLIPVMCEEVLPGDSIKLDWNHFCRMATPITPFMDNVYLDTQAFFVPARLVWDHWQNFMGEQAKPGDSIDYLIPQTSSHRDLSKAVGSVWDYFGLPPINYAGNITVSELPFRAYALIWNEWYRDENLQDPVSINTGDSPNTSDEGTTKFWSTNYSPLPRGKRHDYFTSCLPWPQKFTAPLVGGMVYGTGKAITITNGTDYGSVFTSDYGSWKTRQDGQIASGKIPLSNAKNVGNTGISPQLSTKDKLISIPTREQVEFGYDTGLSTFVSVNDLRQAFAVQRLLENDARGGTRYTELLRAHFGTVSGDARLMRPEYLGGSSTRININPVAQTSATNTGDPKTVTPQGNLAAFGVAGDTGNGFQYSAVEHGYVFVLVSVRADLSYQQGINKQWTRKGRYDFYFPELANLGEQPVLNREIYAQGTDEDDQVFGYQERWAEYRYSPSLITGKFRSTDPQPLDYWHLAQKFASKPTLSADFIKEQPPIERVVAVPSEPHFLLDTWFDARWARPMPVYSIPGLQGHF